MNRVPDKDVDDTASPPAGEPVGRVEFDSRGNSIWRWARDVVESTSVLLRRLDNKDLALEPTQKVPVMRGADRAPPKGGKPEAVADRAAQKAAPTTGPVRHPALQGKRPRDGGGGFDPYNSR